MSGPYARNTLQRADILCSVTTASGGFAARLRALREAAALTQEELAARAGLSAKAVGALERGERRCPYPHTVRALAQALGTDAAAFAEQAAPPTVPPAVPPAVPSAAGPPLIGRDADVAAVRALLGATRLVTVTGPGGVGKTRLAAAAAPDATTVELAALTDVELVLPTMARHLGLHAPGPEDVAGQVAAFLGARPHLLVLDNVEHLLAAAPDVAELLARCPGLTILATSRAPLRVRAEREYPLAPLPVPADGDVATVRASPSAAVFADRARAVSPSFVLDRSTAAAVAAICRRLDGLPLALEIAAAHTRFLAPPDLLARLTDAVSSGGPRDLPPRQRTMRSALDWSHDLLTATEQRVLRRLAPFAGGFELDAAVEVAGCTPEPVEAPDAVAALGGLVEQSLLVAEPADRRFRLLEPVREYAAARLDAAGETAQARRRHATYVAGLGQAARQGLRGADQRTWLDRLAREHGNVRAAWDTLAAGGQPDRAAAAALASDIWPFWALRGHTGEGRRRVEHLLGTGIADGGARAQAHLALAALCTAAGDVAGAATEARTATEEPDCPAGAGAEAAGLLGMALLFAGDPAAARPELERAAAAGAAAGDPFAVAHARIALGQLALVCGDEDVGRELAEAETLARTSGSPFSVATVLSVRATLDRDLGRDDLALQRLVEASELAVEVGTLWTLAYALPGLAVQASRRGSHELAARLFGAGAATQEAAGLRVSYPPERAANERYEAVTRAALGERDYAAAWEAGRTDPPAELIVLVSALQARHAPR